MAVIAYQYRGELVDQVHRGHIAVTDHTGKILWKLGDPERLTFARSSAKPLQAIPVAESGALEHYGITQQELAVICSSHNGESFHVKAVESILHKAGLSPDQLCCGSEYPMYVPAEDAFLSQMEEGALADLLIVSQVRVTVGDALSVTVAPAQGVKCARCWKVLPTVGSDAQHPDLCPRCASVVKKLPVIE